MKYLVRHCVVCGKTFEANRAWNIYCGMVCKSSASRDRIGRVLQMGRFCKQCGKKFTPKNNEQNRQHCGEECARKSAKASRQKFYKDKPEKKLEYYKKATKNGHPSKLSRLYKKYPALSRVCEFCGEERIVEIAHKPQHKRNGSWFRIGDTTPEKIWILCPTCHALIDKKGYSPEQLKCKN